MTGTDTGVGKTRVAVALCRAFAAQGLRVGAMKPVASGCQAAAGGLRNNDALALQAAMNVRADYADVNPYAFAPAIAPHIAAAHSGVVINLEVLDRSFTKLALQSDLMIVEGAGGWLAPLHQSSGFADLTQRWDLRVILVVGLRLGCLNHALLTQESIQRKGVTLAAWVVNRIDPQMQVAEANVATLRERMAAPCMADLPFAPLETADATAQRFNLALLDD